VVIALYALTDAFYFIPNAALSAIIIHVSSATSFELKSKILKLIVASPFFLSLFRPSPIWSSLLEDPTPSG